MLAVTAGAFLLGTWEADPLDPKVPLLGKLGMVGND
jgi:hypothetical protein